MIEQKESNIVEERVDLARKRLNPTVITRMESGWLVLGDNQTIPGYCLLLADPVVGDLNQLGPEARTLFLFEMSLAGDALKHVLGAKVINYSLLGNLGAGLHAHIHPRYDWEEEELRKAPPWKYNFLKVPVVGFDPARDSDIMQKIKNEIEKLKKG